MGQDVGQWHAAAAAAAANDMLSNAEHRHTLSSTFNFYSMHSVTLCDAGCGDRWLSEQRYFDCSERIVIRLPQLPAEGDKRQTLVTETKHDVESDGVQPFVVTDWFSVVKLQRVLKLFKFLLTSLINIWQQIRSWSVNLKSPPDTLMSFCWEQARRGDNSMKTIGQRRHRDRNLNEDKIASCVKAKSPGSLWFFCVTSKEINVVFIQHLFKCKSWQHYLLMEKVSTRLVADWTDALLNMFSDLSCFALQGHRTF